MSSSRFNDNQSSILGNWQGSGYASKTLCFILLTETRLLNFYF